MLHKVKVKDLVVTVDGSCVHKRMGIGIAMRTAGDAQTLKEISLSRGYGTSNRAEYLAVIAACTQAMKYFEYDSLVIYTDSQLVFRQLNGEYRVKNAELKRCYHRAIQALQTAKARLRWHSREDGDGPLADKLANRSTGG